VIRRRDLAAPLDQRTIGIEEQLRVVHRFAVTLVDADGYHDPRLLARVADCVGRSRRHHHGLIEQLQVLTSADDLVGGWMNEKYG
jgi:hypothetical protein